jgi:Protein of unknown function (DUF1275)
MVHSEQSEQLVKSCSLRPARNDRGDPSLVDAISFLPLAHVFTANMTGNIAFLTFATTRVSGLVHRALVNGTFGFSYRGETGKVLLNAGEDFVQWNSGHDSRAALSSGVLRRSKSVATNRKIKVRK